jgi:DNA uptake protein ComE-like DNA-binding protein
MMEIKRYSLDSVVQLNQAVVGRTGNMYYPGTYSKGRPLPAKFMTSEYVTLVSGGQDLPQVDNRVVRKETHGGMEETVISPNKPAVEEINLTDQAKILKEKDKEEIAGLNINTATKQDIIDLDGIGAGTAKKVLQLREIAPFVNYADLNERVGLAFGRDWKDFNIVFE